MFSYDDDASKYASRIALKFLMVLGLLLTATFGVGIKWGGIATLTIEVPYEFLRDLPSSFRHGWRLFLVLQGLVAVPVGFWGVVAGVFTFGEWPEYSLTAENLTVPILLGVFCGSVGIAVACSNTTLSPCWIPFMLVWQVSAFMLGFFGVTVFPEANIHPADTWRF